MMENSLFAIVRNRMLVAKQFLLKSVLVVGA